MTGAEGRAMLAAVMAYQGKSPAEIKAVCERQDKQIAEVDAFFRRLEARLRAEGINATQVGPTL